jgi:hypothetical protein
VKSPDAQFAMRRATSWPVPLSVDVRIPPSRMRSAVEGAAQCVAQNKVKRVFTASDALILPSLAMLRHRNCQLLIGLYLGSTSTRKINPGSHTVLTSPAGLHIQPGQSPRTEAVDQIAHNLLELGNTAWPQPDDRTRHAHHQSGANAAIQMHRHPRHC